MSWIKFSPEDLDANHKNLDVLSVRRIFVFQIILSGSGSVPEHSYPGKVGTLSSVDPNPRDSHTYTVTSGDSGKFKIFGTDLWAMTQFDFESPPNR